MDSLKVSTVDDDEDEDGLDPRIQIELEKLNSATDVINKLEMQLDEANTTFRMLMTDSTRRLKAASSKLGASIVRARPYYEALELSKHAQQECQRAAVKFQRANEIHQAAKETVALAEARFLSKQHEWQFDNAWQEMLNHATIKVTEAENQKSESGREHQKRALLFNAAEQKVQLLEQRLKRSISKSRPYFEEKALLQSRLDAQKACIGQLEKAVQTAKADYAASLHSLEQISEEIHRRRSDKSGTATPRGPREPGVGAELEPVNLELPRTLPVMESYKYDSSQQACAKDTLSLDFDLDSCDVRSVDSVSRATSSAVSEADDLENDPLEEDLEELKQRVRELAVRDNVSRSSENVSWENELTATIDKLDNALLMRECELELRESCGVGSVGAMSGDAGFFSGASSGVDSMGGLCDGGSQGSDGKGCSDVGNQGIDVGDQGFVAENKVFDVGNQGIDGKNTIDVGNQEIDARNQRIVVGNQRINVINQGINVGDQEFGAENKGLEVESQGLDGKNTKDVGNQRINVENQGFKAEIQGFEAGSQGFSGRTTIDVVKHSSDVVDNCRDVLNQGIVGKTTIDIVKNSSDVVDNSRQVVNQGVDVDKSRNDVIDTVRGVFHGVGDVANQDINWKSITDIANHSSDVVESVNSISDVADSCDAYKDRGDAVNQGSDVKNISGVVEQNIDVKNISDETSKLVHHGSECVDQRSEFVSQNTEIVPQDGDDISQSTDVVFL
ncbi:SH3 domain-binding protein 5 isoform X2 [Nilaparvata lugens]|uniref:SH3 domain-binding protein 5 isoform X2 n=1 Tax=Nilaparvata lugens TaxID=108931 RepID=UPI00193E4337|nr:SH3 domain-binding protein 5 isoform X2 [Nilaparvata lugens]